MDYKVSLHFVYKWQREMAAHLESGSCSEVSEFWKAVFPHHYQQVFAIGGMMDLCVLKLSVMR